MKIINLKPKGSIISRSELSETPFHIIKFYTRIKQEENNWIVVGYEATEKHVLGHCKYCEIEENDENE